MAKKNFTGDDRTKPMPDQFAHLEIDATIEADAYQLIEQGFRPETADDKWFVQMDGEKMLRVYRSATGSCIFEAQFAPAPQGYTIVEAKVNRNPKQYMGVSVGYDARLFIYLIRKLLLKHNVPFPMPENVPQKQRRQHEELVMGKNNGGDGGDGESSTFIPLNILN